MATPLPPGHVRARVLPVAKDFTPDEAAKVAQIEAAPDAEESLRERVARAIWEADFNSLSDHGVTWENEAETNRKDYRNLADAAIAVMRGESFDAAAILRDVLDLIAVAERHEPAHRYISTKRLRDAITGVAS